MIYAATDAGLAISTDDGANFINRTTAEGLGSNSISKVFVAGSNVYAIYPAGVSISTNGGASFTAYGGIGYSYKGYANGNNIYIAAIDGLWASATGGASFTRLTQGLGAGWLLGVHGVGDTLYVAHAAGGISVSAPMP